MVVHAPPEASGSFIRLIRSLERADYLGSIPSLTVELPSRVDPQLLQFLQDMKWPPGHSNKINIRRRIHPQDLSPAESSARAVEAFYPKDPRTSHVLLLSPQVEVSPSFFHYLKYTLLNYKQTFPSEGESSTLFGISLDLPSSKPTVGDAPFSPPLAVSSEDDTVTKHAEVLPHFLWQAPNSNAALYFGDKWAEFHSFLSRRLALQGTGAERPAPEKLISGRYPAFMEYMLEFVRAKGYHMLYPSFQTNSTFSLVSVHSDLFSTPEEFASHASSTGTGDSPEDANEWAKDAEPIKKLNPASTLSAFTDQFSPRLPPLSSLDLLSFSGESVSKEAYREKTREYLKEFRVTFGGCHDAVFSPSPDSPEWQELFCPD